MPRPIFRTKQSQLLAMLLFATGMTYVQADKEARAIDSLSSNLARVTVLTQHGFQIEDAHTIIQLCGWT